MFASMGLFVLLVGLFPNLRPPPAAALPMAICWLTLPAWGLLRHLTRKSKSDVQPRSQGTSTQVGLFFVFMLGVGLAYYFWANHLGVNPLVLIGTLLVIEGLGGVIVSLTEWWRLSHAGVSFGLITGGFSLPFVDKFSVAVPVGGTFLMGSVLSAGVLYWQLRCERIVSPTDLSTTRSQ
ncbi:hypothetical protein V5E97_25875 [Singulisphaera sp. Ch08]|uniref:Uncharacterized protein n=1 Tax=Singulisphaera sp. Ch08 TaxID=3120278 RepID=A0AAU7C939_9BACT